MSRILTTMLLVVGLTIPLGLFSQVYQADPQAIIANILEDLASMSEEEIDLDALAEDLVFFIENPINLNSTSADELNRLVFLSDFQITSLLDYIKSQGAILTVFELQMVYGFDFTDIQKLLPFVTVEPADQKTDLAAGLKYGKNDLIIRAKSLVETPKGYTLSNQPEVSQYAGNKLSLYTRYSFKTRKNFQAGFVAEKDAGEEFFKGSNPYGFDHLSFHAQLSDVGKIKSLVIGDFNADFGQGLTLWSSTSFGKSSDVMGYRKRARGLHRYSSTNENQFLRGAGATIQLGRFYVSAFGSYKYIDANVTDTLVDNEMAFTSLPTSGFHRTPNEIKNKKALGETVLGTNVNTSFGNLRLGVTGSFVNLEGSYIGVPQLYKSFEPLLDNRVNLGTDASYGLGNHILFAEVAHTLGHGMGIVGGGAFRLHPLLNFSLLARSYDKDFSSHYTAALSEGTGNANEKGFLAAFHYTPIKHWELSGYTDFFSSSWVRFNVSSPSRGSEQLIQATYSPRSSVSFNVRYRNKQKEKNTSIDSVQIRWVLPYSTQSLRFHCSYSPTQSIVLKSRIEFSWYDAEGAPSEKGLLLYQDVSYRSSGIPLTITARFAIYDTDGWNARIYAYENDVLYSFSIPAYYSQGTRFFIIGKYSVGRRADIWLRYSQSYYAHVTTIGTGLDEIQGPTRSDISAQLRIRF